MLNDTLVKTATPESEGIRSESLRKFYQTLDESPIEFHHVAIARHGKLISQASWAPYTAEYPHMAHSLTKLFTNTAVGIACDEGLISLDDKVIGYFPEFEKSVANEKALRMTVRDLITMRCGHDHLISGNKWRPIKTSWVAEFFKEPVAYEPGTHFQYTSATSYILSAIVQKVTGMTTFEYLNIKLLKDMQFSEMTWDRCPHGICSGGNGITITNIDALKIGILYLNNGVWMGKRYLSHAWIQEAMYNSCKLNPDTGYGFHMCNENGIISSGGIFGQTIVIVPKYDMVISINAANQNNRPNALDRSMRNLLEDALFPIIGSEPLQEDDVSFKNLGMYISNLALPEPKGVGYLPDGSFKDVKHCTYSVEENVDNITKIAVTFGDKSLLFSITDHRGTHTIECGYSSWIYSESTMTGNYLHHQYQPDSTTVAAKVYKGGGNIIIMKWAWVKMTFVDTAICRFEGDKIYFKRYVNVNTQSKERPEIVGIRT